MLLLILGMDVVLVDVRLVDDERMPTSRMLPQGRVRFLCIDECVGVICEQDCMLWRYNKQHIKKIRTYHE